MQGGRDLSSGNVSRPFSPNPADTLLLAGRGGRSSLRGSPRGNKKRARIDYRVWEPQRHVRHYFPEIAMIQGNFVRGRITGSVLVRFHDGALYTGPWVDAQEPRSKHHWGSWKTPENRTYIGASVDHHLDVGNITGAMFEVRYPWGEIYQGPLLKGKRHGWGRCQYSNGGDYIGQWWYDRRHGFGRMVTMDNALGGLIKYEGPWRHDKEHGNGRCRFPDGSSFEGMYRHGLMHGQGIRHFANGNTYKGAYSQGSMCGYGVLKYADQRTYKGEFKDDKRHGHGELVYPERHTLGHSTVAGATKVLRRIAPVGSSSSPSIGSPSAQDGELPMEPVTLDDIKTAVQALGADVESRPASRHVRFTENLRPGTVGSMFGKGSTGAEGVGGGGVNTLLNSRGRGGGMAGTKAAGGGARGHGGAPAVDTPVWQPPPAESKIRESGAGVLKYRGDWGAYGGEMYNGPFVDGHEHGEAQWIVPTNLSGGRMVRRGTWVKGIRKKLGVLPCFGSPNEGVCRRVCKPKTLYQHTSRNDCRWLSSSSRRN